MELFPLTRPLFSAKGPFNYAALIAALLLVIIPSALLIIYWEDTRTMEMINSLQQYRSSTLVEYFFRTFTYLGNEEFYVALLGLLFWCINKPFAFGVGAMVIFSGFATAVVKDYTALARPVLEGMSQAESYAFPSGHTLNAIAVWGYLALRFRRTAFWIWAIAASAIIAFSRIILGYHYPGDILGGIAMGLTVLLLFAWLSSVMVEKGWVQKFTLPIQYALAIALPAILALLLIEGDITKLMGLTSGAALGYIIDKQKLHFVPQAPWHFQALKFILGMAGVIGIVFGLGAVLPGDIGCLVYLKYLILGAWVTLLAPALFVALRLTPREQSD